MSRNPEVERLKPEILLQKLRILSRNLEVEWLKPEVERLNLAVEWLNLEVESFNLAVEWLNLEVEWLSEEVERQSADRAYFRKNAAVVRSGRARGTGVSNRSRG